MYPNAFEILIAANGWVLSQTDMETDLNQLAICSSDEKLLELLRDRLKEFRAYYNSLIEKYELEPQEAHGEEDEPKCLKGISFSEDLELSDKEFTEAQESGTLEGVKEEPKKRRKRKTS